MAFSASAAYSALDIPAHLVSDDSALRNSLQDAWFQAPISEVLKKQKQVTSLATGEKIEIRSEKGTSDVRILLARERNRQYPGWVQGSWILYRDLRTGDPVKIRIYLRSDPYVYLELRPGAAGRSVLDLVAYSGYLLYENPLPFTFKQLYSLPVQEILSSLQSRFPWNYVTVDPRLYEDSRTLVSLIQRGIKDLRYADDGAL
ncbi:MAG: hypothetical protein SNJ56_04805, partial [Termitinemataceae bacterium]